MKALFNIVNVLAMIMVLLLGSVSVHAHDGGHSHAMDVLDVFETEDGVDFALDGHPSDGSTMHCGAPILGPQAVELSYTIASAKVVYPTETTADPLNLSSGGLRPPRR